MQDSLATEDESVARIRPRRHWRRLLVVFAIMLLLLGVPWWTLLSAGTKWPTVVIIAGTGVFAAAFVGLPVLMTLGHGRRHLDWAAAAGDALLGVMWVLFVWSVLAQLFRLALFVAGGGGPGGFRAGSRGGGGCVV